MSSGWERFRRITWPLLAPTTLVVVLLTTIKAFQVFDLVAVVTKGGPQGASEVLLYETYLQAFSYFRIGYGSALTMLFILFVGGVSALQMWSASRRRPP
ncbi:carbohydrate ABC transporter permease [Rhizobium binxianense]